MESCQSGLPSFPILRRSGWFDPGLIDSSAELLYKRGWLVAGAGVNPADQRWDFWPLLPLGFMLQE